MALASAGVPVFPCVPLQKNPLTEHGFHDASTEASVVSGWWRQWPDANVAMPTGFASGIDVVDIDVHASGSGFDALQQARSAGLLGTPAWVASTPSGGMHACFLRTGSVEQRSWQVPGRHVDFPFSRSGWAWLLSSPRALVRPVGVVSGRLVLCRRRGEGDGTGPHQPVRGREQHVQVVQGLADPSVACLGESEVALDDQERMLDLHPHPGVA